MYIAFVEVANKTIIRRKKTMYHSWLDEEDAERQREEKRMYPQQGLAAAESEIQKDLQLRQRTHV